MITYWQWLLLLFVSLFCNLPVDNIHAQPGNSNANKRLESDPLESKKVRRKKRRKKMRTPDAANEEQTRDDLGDSQIPGDAAASNVEDDDKNSLLLPDWQAPIFGWNLGPIVGFKYQSVTQDRIATSTLQSEFGGAASVRGVPVVAGNPGAYVAPGIGYAIGRIDGKRKYDETGKEDDLQYRYDRLYAGAEFSFYYAWYRHTLGLNGGRKLHFQEDDSIEGKPENLFSASIMNDFGVLVLPWVSGHYTHTYRQTHFGSFDKAPFLREHDNWVHTRLFTSILNFHIDIGPGFTNTTEIFRQGEPEEAKLIGRVDYLRALAGLDLFWKLGANAHGKYVFNSTEKQIGNNSKILLPDQNLYETPRLVMPEDSFIASTFIGANDVLFGFGLGWQYNIQVLNVSKKRNRERETTQDNGFALTYTATF